MSIGSSPVSSSPSPGTNSSGRMPRPTRFDRWMRSKDCASTARTPSSAGPFAAQSRDDPVPYSLPATTMIGLGGVVDGGQRAVRPGGDGSFDALGKGVLEPKVAEGTTHHHLMVASSRCVGVQLVARDALVGEVAAGDAVRPDGARG